MSKKKITKKKVKKSKSVKAKKSKSTKAKKSKKYKVVYHFRYVLGPKIELKMIQDHDGVFRVYSRTRGEKLWTFETEAKKCSAAFGRMAERMFKYTPADLLKG